MAKTYFNYQPRDPQAQINWAEAANNLGNTFKEEARVRTEKKAAIDEATRNFQKELAKGVPGESTTIREWGLNYAGDAENQMDMLTMMLKSGQMSVSDYTKNKQNLVDGTEEAFSLMEEYQTEYANKMERLQSEDPATASQKLEAWLMESVEGFGDFNKTQLVIDPSTGKVMAGRKVKNEKTGLMELSTDPNDIVPVSSLKGNILSKFNKYDVEKSTKNWAGNLAELTSVSRTIGTRTRAGEILTVVSKIPAQYDSNGKRIMNKVPPEVAKEYGLDQEAVSALNDYIAAEDDWINGQISNPYNMTSILTDYVNQYDGKEITFTLNADEAKENPNMILLKREGGTVVPVFDESINPNAKEQKEEIMQYMKYAIRTKVGESRTIKTYNDYNSPTYAPIYKDERYWTQKDKTTEPDLENVEDTYIRLLEEKILPISEGKNIFFPKNEGKTRDKLQSVLNTQLNLEGFKAVWDYNMSGAEYVRIENPDGEEVITFDLDNMTEEDYSRYMYDLYDVSSTNMDSDKLQKEYQLAGQRLSKEEGDRRAAERRERRYGKKKKAY